MLADISGVDAIYIVTGYTDMRKSIDGLCALVQEQFPANENLNALYLFCGRKCDRIKALLKEPDGMVLIYKKLTVQGVTGGQGTDPKSGICPGGSLTGSCPASTLISQRQ